MRNKRIKFSCVFTMLVFLVQQVGFGQIEGSSKRPNESSRSRKLFDGKSLNGWKVTNFGGEGECSVSGGVIVVESGYPMSGLTYTGKKLPRVNYEIVLEARRTQGDDFFCGLTFRVNESLCTFVVGGWGGGVTGLSCIDERDASSNDTRRVVRYELNHWYRIRLRVEAERIQAWIDDKQLVDKDIKGCKISLRNETLPSRPLGLSNFQTESEFKNIEIRLLSDHER
ncbi:MAG: DUF1080 domain-containing protein [Planctomycetota bacterium]